MIAVVTKANDARGRGYAGRPDAYADTLAHFLERTAFPVGRRELPADRDALRSIRAAIDDRSHSSAVRRRL